MTTSSDVIAGLELALASADAMIERLTGERAVVRINGRLTWLGVFDSEAEAAAVAAPHFAGIEA